MNANKFRIENGWIIKDFEKDSYSENSGFRSIKIKDINCFSSYIENHQYEIIIKVYGYPSSDISLKYDKSELSEYSEDLNYLKEILFK